MDNILTMKIANSLQSLDKEFESLTLRKYTLRILIRKEVSLLRIFHYHIDRISIQNSVPQLDDMWMVQLRMQSDFSLN